MINPYIYTKQNNGVNCQLKEHTALWTHYSVDIPSALSAEYLGNNRIKGEYLFPKNASRAPLAILVHGMGDRSIYPCKLIARTLAKNGIACFILYLVFHTRRMPEAIKGKYPKLTAQEWFESYQISVTDIRQVIDWASTRPEIIQERVSIVGISFGGFISSIAMALDTRLRSGVFIVSGGNSDKITKHSLLLRWQYKINLTEYRRNQESYKQYLTEVAEKGFENVIPGKSSYLTDPKTFATYLRHRPVMMLNALWDEMIPKVATLDLWEAYGKPPIKWYPATHASIWLLYPLMGPGIVSFIKSSLMLEGARS
jgi:cephalosporin-C deacetylase-like acetyl esterase